MSARFRQFLTGFLLPAIALLFAVILVLIIIGKPQVGKKELLCAVIVFPLMLLGIVSGTKGAAFGFARVDEDRESGLYRSVPLLGRPQLFTMKGLIGFSSSTVGLGGGASEGIILYMKGGGHLELSKYSHKTLDGFIHVLKNEGVPYLGHERSHWLFWKYRFDPK